MKRAGFSLEARTAAEEEEGVRMVACELEAAEALAGLARCSALRGGDVTSGELERQLVTHSQEKLKAAQQEFNDYTSTRITSPEIEKIEKIVKNNPSQLRGRNSQSNSVSKSRPKLTEGEKQARKHRRILANREAARETIRRRQAMFLDLNRKAADVLEENENLKKEKELAVEEYNSLKYRNEFLKAQLAKTQKAEPEDPKTSWAEKSCSQPIQPPIVPCFWPPIFPPSDVFKFQCASHSHDLSSSEFPLFLYPVPWMLPFFAQGSTPHSHYGTKDTGNAHQCSTCLCPETLAYDGDIRLSTNRSMRGREASNSRKSMAAGGVHGPGSTFPPESGDEGTTHHRNGTIFVPGLFTRVKPQETPRAARNDVGVDLSQKNQESIIKPHKETEGIFAATEARRKRKELMKIKKCPFSSLC